MSPSNSRMCRNCNHNMAKVLHLIANPSNLPMALNRVRPNRSLSEAKPILRRSDQLVVFFAPDGSALQRSRDVPGECLTISPEILGGLCNAGERDNQRMRVYPGVGTATNLYSEDHPGCYRRSICQLGFMNRWGETHGSRKRYCRPTITDCKDSTGFQSSRRIFLG